VSANRLRQQRRQGPAALRQTPTDKKIGMGVVNHCNTVVEALEHVADLVRKGLEYIPAERPVIPTDCGFGREGRSRRIAYHKCVSLVEGTNIVRRELGLPEVPIRAADPKLYFANVSGA
jgi:5-methyltetrahydropteroyltriglutamate--homocysteine methyltransferase